MHLSMAGVTLSSFRWLQGKLLSKSPQGSLEVVKIKLIRLRILEQKNALIYFRVRWNTFGNPLYCRNKWNQIYPTSASVCSRRTCGPADTCKIKKQLFFFACQLWLRRPGLFTSALCVSSVGTNSALCCHIPELPPWMFTAAWKVFLHFVSFSLSLNIRKVFNHISSDPSCEVFSWQEKPLYLFSLWS